MISPSELRAAAEAIRRGELVAFPTETVYGLGANALNPAAVAQIYEVKGRPATSPLIVHVSSVEQAREFAAPSANRFTGLSPTTAEHVRKSLGHRVHWILDGGPTTVGIESTVVAITRQGVHLLRPGTVTTRQIEAVVGPLQPAPETDSASHPSPGLHRRHYQPQTALHLATPAETPPSGRGAYLYLSKPLPSASSTEMPPDPQAYAACLFAVLHDLDARGFDWIGVEPPPDTPEWAGVRDRLTRASAGIGTRSKNL